MVKLRHGQLHEELSASHFTVAKQNPLNPKPQCQSLPCIGSRQCSSISSPTLCGSRPDLAHQNPPFPIIPNCSSKKISRMRSRKSGSLRKSSSRKPGRRGGMECAALGPRHEESLGLQLRKVGCCSVIRVVTTGDLRVFTRSSTSLQRCVL